MTKNKNNLKINNLKAIYKRIQALSEKKIVVGIPKSHNGQREDGLSNALIAMAHEFGVPGRIPERSFLRSTLAENKENAAKLLVKGIKGELSKVEFTDEPFEVTGQVLAGLVKKKISDGLSPELSDSTKRARERKAAYLSKGQKASRSDLSMTPLFDSGEMLNSITFEIRKNAK